MNEANSASAAAPTAIPTVPTPIPTEEATVGPSLSVPATRTIAESAVKVHDASRISDSAYWAAHGAAFGIAILSLVLVFAVKGPSRREAIEALARSQKK